MDEGPEPSRRRSGGTVGGTLSDKGLSIEFLALASLAGIEPREFLKAESDEELAFLILVANKAIEAQEIQHKNLAATIINYLGKSLSKDK